MVEPDAANQVLDKLGAIIAVTRQVKTVVVVETALPNSVYFRIADGHAFSMGEQFFSTREESDDESLPRGLAGALPDRLFAFRQRDTILLNCGEVMVVHGRDHVDFYWSVPQVLRDAVRGASTNRFRLKGSTASLDTFWPAIAPPKGLADSVDFQLCGRLL